ncbi:unnamed protein product [Dibothriocephalus latus]|uniref:Uncharacterized protein n=1 Tax=Dibothriocephalus latus TaxID=60516 RepID=A0A3P7N2P1_DIBLA|nr:unnamed protein product [Dibothriocephalus latus]
MKLPWGKKKTEERQSTTGDSRPTMQRRSTFSRVSVYHHLSPVTLTSRSGFNQSALATAPSALQRLLNYNPSNEDDGLPSLEPKAQDPLEAALEPPCKSLETKQQHARKICMLSTGFSLFFLLVETFFLVASCFVACEKLRKLLKNLAGMGFAAVLLEWCRTAVWREPRPTTCQRRPCHALTHDLQSQLEAQADSLAKGNISDCPVSQPAIISIIPQSRKPECEADCEYRGALLPQHSRGTVRFVLTLLLTLLYFGGLGLFIWARLLMDDCNTKSSLTLALIYFHMALVLIRLTAFGWVCRKLRLYRTFRRSYPKVPIVYVAPRQPPLMIGRAYRIDQGSTRGSTRSSKRASTQTPKILDYLRNENQMPAF